MNTQKATRKITRADVVAANKLRAIYKAKAKQLGLTQVTLAERWGCKQGAISQYLNGKIALNTDAILFFATQLEVEPEEIRDDLFRKHRQVKPKNQTVEVRFRLDTKVKAVQNRTLEVTDHTFDQGVYAIEVSTTSYEPFYMKGSHLLVDPNMKPKAGDMLFVKFNNGSYVVARAKRVDETVQAIQVSSRDEVVFNPDEAEIMQVIVGVQENRNR